MKTSAQPKTGITNEPAFKWKVTISGERPRMKVERGWGMLSGASQPSTN